MQRNDETQDRDLIDLGSVTAETKVKSIGFDDHEGGLQPLSGLTDD